MLERNTIKKFTVEEEKETRAINYFHNSRSQMWMNTKCLLKPNRSCQLSDEIGLASLLCEVHELIQCYQLFDSIL